MAMKASGTQGTWKSIELSAKNIKHDISSRIPKDWNDGHIGKLLKNIKERIFDITLKNASYIIGRHNLLKNDGIVEYDPNPHFDYACRAYTSWVVINYTVILLSIIFVSYLIVVVIFSYIKWTYNRAKGLTVLFLPL